MYRPGIQIFRVFSKQTWGGKHNFRGPICNGPEIANTCFACHISVNSGQLLWRHIYNMFWSRRLVGHGLRSRAVDRVLISNNLVETVCIRTHISSSSNRLSSCLRNKFSYFRFVVVVLVVLVVILSFGVGLYLKLFDRSVSNLAHRKKAFVI